jgi:hypothetical protein
MCIFRGINDSRVNLRSNFKSGLSATLTLKNMDEKQETYKTWFSIDILQLKN